MKARWCYMIGCPRLVAASTGKRGEIFAQCNQQMPDTTIWWTDCSGVSRERCKELRKELKKQREVQG